MYKRTQTAYSSPEEKKYAKKYCRYKDICEIYSIGTGTARRLVKESDSVCKIGNVTLINLEKFDAYVKSFML